MSRASLASRGWPILFPFAGPLGFLGLGLRTHLEDSPPYQRLVEDPTTGIVREVRGERFQSGVIACLSTAGLCLALGYMPVYLSEELKIRPASALLASTIALSAYVCSFFLAPIFEALGRKRRLVLAYLRFIILTVPLFALLNTTSLTAIVLVGIAFAILLSTTDGTGLPSLSRGFGRAGCDAGVERNRIQVPEREQVAS